MTTLGELARLIRSKNAGPFTLTFDVMFADEASFRRVVAAGVVTRERVAAIYRLDPREVLVFEHAAACAIKVSIPRPAAQGDRDDGDMFGGQQHAPLVDLPVTE
jgi:hypothetical protein